MTRHAVDGPRILRLTPQVPALAPIVRLEPHVEVDVSGDPAHGGARRPGRSTGVVTVVAVFGPARTQPDKIDHVGDRNR